MSRIGKKLITLPEGVEIKLSGRKLDVKGKLGTLNLLLTDEFDVVQEDKKVRIVPKGEASDLSAKHGMIRSLVANMVKGVSEGFQRTLKIVGVGYKAEVQGKTLKLALGYSHPIQFALPEGIQATFDAKANAVT